MDERRRADWMLWASVVLIVVGAMRIVDAVWAWQYDGVAPDGLDTALLGDEMETYGWLWLAVGVVLVLAGFALTRRAPWARWVGVVAGAVMAVTAAAWLPVYPVWSAMYVAIGVLLVHGLVAHGDPTAPRVAVSR